ncbi:ATP-binding protein [Pyxidicoccus sp. 3LFB2]
MQTSTHAPSPEIEAVLAGHAADTHLVQFYDDDGFLFDVVARFIGDGLRKAEPCVVIATEAHCEGFLARLRALGIPADEARARGQLILLDARDTLSQFMVDGMPDWTLFKSVISPVIEQLHGARHGVRVRAYGEMVDLLWGDGSPAAAIRLEEFWNDLGRLHSFSLLCAYVMGHFRTGDDAEAFHQVCRTHSHVIPCEQYSQIASDDSRLRRISALEQRARALEHEVEQRKRVEQELLEAVRVREDFLSIAGHELRTPLTVMQLQLDSLLAQAAKEGSEPLSARINRLRKQAGRLGCLVEDLLDVSRLSAGRFTLEPQAVDLVEVVREVADRFEETARRAGCDLRVLADGPVPGSWDPLRVEQVVTNLLTNALKYGAGRPIEVTARRTRTRARLVVRDEGVGIPLRDQARIFHRFERAAASRNYGGLGLGLWIVRQLVEAHRGTVRVESEPDEGATFIVELPL